MAYIQDAEKKWKILILLRNTFNFPLNFSIQVPIVLSLITSHSLKMVFLYPKALTWYSWNEWRMNGWDSAKGISTETHKTVSAIPEASETVVVLHFLKFISAALSLRCCTWLSLVVVSGGYSSLWYLGFSLWWLLLLWNISSKSTGFSSCGMWAQ